MTVDRTVLLSLIPYNRRASASEIAVQLGQTPSIIREAIADLIADGLTVDANTQGYRRYTQAIDVTALEDTPTPSEPLAVAPETPAPVAMRHKSGRRAAVDAVPSSLAIAIKQARIAAGLSQNALARLSGIDPAYVNRFERGIQDARPSRTVVLAMADAMDFDTAATDRLLYLSDHAPITDYQSLYEDAVRRLTDIDRALTGFEVSSAGQERKERAS